MKLNIHFQVDVEDSYIQNLVMKEIKSYAKTDDFKSRLQYSMKESISNIFEQKMFDDTIDSIQSDIVDPFIEKVTNIIKNGVGLGE